MAQVERFPGTVKVAEDDEEDAVFWHLKDDNGEIITQGEAHTSPANVQRAVNNVALEFAKLYFEAADAKRIDVAALENFEEWPVIDIPIQDLA